MTRPARIVPTPLPLLLLCLLALALLLPRPLHARGALHIDVTKGGLEPLPIALPAFVTLSGQGVVSEPGEEGRQLIQVVTNDLRNSGLFRPLDPNAFLQPATDLWRLGPSHREWRLVGAEAVVSGAVRREGNRLTVDFYLHDVFRGTLVGPGKRFSTSPGDWRHLAHRISDEIYTRLTGEGGYFATRIALIGEENGRKRLMVMDQDGANRRDLTPGDHLVLTPRFSPNGESLFYLSYETGEPRIFRWDLYTGRKSRQSDYPGLNSAPSWSPDGTKMALTLSKDGNPEIYVKDLARGTLTRLTHGNAINTSPSWSPDGQRIVFNSNRGGSPQLYVMRADGSEVKRITFEGGYNAAPAWSPRGDLIAYVKGGGGKFRIAVVDPEGRRSRVLTDSWMDESPTWSPNGRVILFSRQSGDETHLYTIDLTGHNERRLPLGNGVYGSDPSWSPLVR